MSETTIHALEGLRLPTAWIRRPLTTRHSSTIELDHIPQGFQTGPEQVGGCHTVSSQRMVRMPGHEK